MQNNILLIVYLFVMLLVNILIYCSNKDKSIFILNIVLALLLVFSFVLSIIEIQCVPVIFKLIITFILIAEVVVLFVAMNNKVIYIIAIVLLLGLSTILGGFHKADTQKHIDDIKYVGVYDSITGVSETKVYYYRSYNNVFMSAKCYCVENYGIVLTGKPDFKSTPYSVEYCDEAK